MESPLPLVFVLWGAVMVLVPEIPFRLQYFDLAGAELSDGGRVVIRVLGAVVVLVGLGILYS